MNLKILLPASVERRKRWVEEIQAISENFGSDITGLTNRLSEEIKTEGSSALLDHLRLCGAIPEAYGHDSTQEKLYSKYTDTILAFAFSAIGFSSEVLVGRADSADVEFACTEFSFIADAKAFRLSRTAKNQKDFKVSAMSNWKQGNPHAIVILS